MTKLNFAYLSHGKLRLRTDDQPPRTVESKYGEIIRERALKSQQRHSWKSQGAGDNFLSGQILWGKAAQSGNSIPLAVTSLSRGSKEGQFLYTLESGSLCGVLAVDGWGSDETRVWNNINTRVRHLCTAPCGDIVCCSEHRSGTANIGIMLGDDRGLREITEGDSFDTAPSWIPGSERQIIYQSAGVGRNREGHFAGLGPFSLQKLDLETGAMSTVTEDPKYDFLTPKATADGTLYFIRRPHDTGHNVSLLQVIKDTLLFPFRLCYAVFQFLNFFSMMYSGRKLSGSAPGGAQAKNMDLKQMMIWGNIVNANKAAESGDKAPDLVPASWQLMRVTPSGRSEAIAKGVLTFDVNPDGLLIYSNGTGIFTICDGKPVRILVDRMIEQVALL